MEFREEFDSDSDSDGFDITSDTLDKSLPLVQAVKNRGFYNTTSSTASTSSNNVSTSNVQSTSNTESEKSSVLVLASKTGPKSNVGQTDQNAEKRMGFGRARTLANFNSESPAEKTQPTLKPGGLTQTYASGSSGQFDHVTVSHTDHARPGTSSDAGAMFDDRVHWKSEASNQQYVMKAKHETSDFRPGITNPAAQSCNLPNHVDFENVRKANPDVSPTWLASLMAKAPPQQSTVEMKGIMSKLEGQWYEDRTKDKSRVAQHLARLFQQSVNPYILTGFLIEHIQDTLVAKTTTLSFFVLREFEKWCKANRSLDSSEFMTSDLQMTMYDICTRQHLILFDMAVRCFNLCFHGNDAFLPKIKEFVEKKKFKEAAVCAGKLGLQHHFKMTEIVLPLILQDKVNLVETYVYGNQTQQFALVQYLDHLSDRDTDLSSVLSSVGPVPGVKGVKFQKKTLGKLAARLMKLYKVPQEVCPNIMNARGVGALRYLLHKKFVERGMGTGSWEEMIFAAVGDNQYLKEQLVDQLACFNELTEAAKWADIFQLSDDVLPESVKVAREKLKQDDGNGIPVHEMAESEENWEESCFSPSQMEEAYYKLSLPDSHIILVDDATKYQECLAYITQPGSVVGIDSEWKPGFCGKTQKVALMQLATRDRAYLLDIPALNQFLTPQDWTHFAEVFFCSEHVLKLGYGIESDLKMFLLTFPSMEEPLRSLQRVTNLEVLANKVLRLDVLLLDENEDSDVLPGKPDKQEAGSSGGFSYGFSPSEERGLSDLVRRCLGKPLSKTEQMSNWERRPLRPAQITYATLDAFVLLELHEHLTRLAGQQQMVVDLEPRISMKWMKPSKNEKRKARIRGAGKQTPPQKQVRRPFQPPRDAQDLRVVVDTMLCGLGKQLRACGVDVYILDQFADHSQVVQVCLEQKRIALTAGSPYQMVVSRVGPEMCYNVLSEGAKEQVVEVLKYFNVTVTQGDIFSRCQVCNGNVYLTVPSEAMKMLWDKKQELLHNDTTTADVTAPRNCVPGTSASSDNALQFESLGIDWNTVSALESKAPLQVGKVPVAMFGKVATFYCCATCGKVFWEGSHFDRVCDQFAHVLDTSQPVKTVYQERS